MSIAKIQNILDEDTIMKTFFMNRVKDLELVIFEKIDKNCWEGVYSNNFPNKIILRVYNFKDNSVAESNLNNLFGNMRKLLLKREIQNKNSGYIEKPKIIKIEDFPVLEERLYDADSPPEPFGYVHGWVKNNFVFIIGSLPDDILVAKTKLSLILRNCFV